MFKPVAGPVAEPGKTGCFWRGRRLRMIDGSCVDVPASKANRAAFDGPSNGDGPGAFPQVRLVAHAECGTKALLDATFDGYLVAETVLTERLLSSGYLRGFWTPFGRHFGHRVIDGGFCVLEF